MEEVFDYGSISEDHKKVALEIANLAKQTGNTVFAELILHKFAVVEPRRYNLDESEFIGACKKHNIHYNIQGFVKEGPGHDPLHFPIVSITEDIRILNKFISEK